MISFAEAQKRIAAHVVTQRSRSRPLERAHNMTLANDLFAPIDLPSFDNSAVDGYAVNAHDAVNLSLKQSAVIKAEGQSISSLSPTSATKIMTGAPVPQGANAIVMLEDSFVEGENVSFKKQPNVGDHIRIRGEDVREGTRIARAGTKLSPPVIGLLAGLGFVDAPVFVAPSIKLISTGDELAMPGTPLQFGQVYYLMGPMLRAQAAQLGVHNFSAEVVVDKPDAIRDALNRAFDADIILLTGGMSKGDYDFVRNALHDQRCEEIFYQGAWRPGKPLYFGKKDHSLIFGLPGNPVAAFVCFHVFVRYAILRAQQAHDGLMKTAIAMADFVKKPGLTFFTRGYVNQENQMHFLDGQGSHQIFSLSQANALCLVPEDKAIVKSGEVVHYYALA